MTYITRAETCSMARDSNAYTVAMHSGLCYDFQLSITLCARLTYSEVQEENQSSARTAYHKWPGNLVEE